MEIMPLVIAAVMLSVLISIKESDCGIVVVNKLTKKPIFSANHQFLVSGLDKAPLDKVQLIVCQPSKTCSIPKPSRPEVLSLHATEVRRPTVLLVEQDKCNIENKILKAKAAGYQGIIFHWDEANFQWFVQIRERHSHLQDFYIAVISNDEGRKLIDFVKPQYYFHIFRDLNFSEKVAEYRSICYAKLVSLFNRTKRVVKYFETWIQLLLLILPWWLFIRWSAASSRTQNEYESWDHDGNWNYEISSSTGPDLSEYRTLLDISEDATREEIERAFRRRAALFHPDKHVHLPEEERLKKQEEFKLFSVAKIALLEHLGAHST